MNTTSFLVVLAGLLFGFYLSSRNKTDKSSVNRKLIGILVGFILALLVIMASR